MFSIEGRFFKALTKAGDFLILAVIGLVFCIPIVTIGGSITAMFYVGMKLVRDEESYVFRNFMHSFKQNFKQGFVMELIAAIVAGLLVTDIWACYRWYLTSGNSIIRIFTFVIVGILLVWSAVVLYAFPMIAKFDNTIKNTIRNALVICVHHLPQTFVMLLATYGLVIFSLYFVTAFIVTIPLIFYIDSYILSRIFLQFTKKKEDAVVSEEAEETAVVSEGAEETAE